MIDVVGSLVHCDKIPGAPCDGIAADQQIYLLTVYAKADMKDLTRDQIRALRKLVKTEIK